MDSRQIAHVPKSSANRATTDARRQNFASEPASRSNYANDQQQQQSTFAARRYPSHKSTGEFARAHTAGVFPVCFIVRSARSQNEESARQAGIVVRREESLERTLSLALQLGRGGVFCFIVPCSSKSIASVFGAAQRHSEPLSRLLEGRALMRDDLSRAVSC